MTLNLTIVFIVLAILLINTIVIGKEFFALGDRALLKRFMIPDYVIENSQGEIREDDETLFHEMLLSAQRASNKEWVRKKSSIWVELNKG